MAKFMYRKINNKYLSKYLDISNARHIFVSQNAAIMKKQINQIKALLKDRGIKAQVKSMGADTIIIDNLPLMVDADAIASIACGGTWVYMTKSMTKLKA